MRFTIWKGEIRRERHKTLKINIKERNQASLEFGKDGKN